MNESVEPRRIAIPGIVDPTGRIAVVEAEELLPFEIRRVFLLHDLAGDATRGAHAHRLLHEFLLAAAGSFRVVQEAPDGTRWEFELTSPDSGVYVPPLHWCTVDCFSPGAVCLALCSRHYDPSDYIHEYAEFRRMGEVPG